MEKQNNGTGAVSPDSQVQSTLDKASTDRLVPRLRAAFAPAALPPPDVYLALRMDSLFRYDPSVFTIYERSSKTLKVYVKGMAKAEAIGWLMGRRNHSGDIAGPFAVKVFRVLEDGSLEEMATPTYDVTPEGVFGYLRDALKGIGFYSEFNTVTDPVMGRTFYFCEVEPLGIKAKADNLANPYGYQVSLAEDLVALAFDTSGVMLSTYARDGE